MRVIAIDIGGTKIDLGVVELAQPAEGTPASDTGRSERVVERLRMPTPHGAAEILAACVAGIERLMATHGDVEAVGIGAPGIIDPATGSVRFASAIVPGWSGADVRSEIERATGLPVSVANDVRAAALGAVGPESRKGRTLLVSLGTGVGGAVLENETLVTGATGSAGEIAHLTTASAGALPCGCGRQHHLEALVSGPALAASIAAETGAPADLREIAALLQRDTENSPAITRVIDRIGREAGETLAGLVSALDVDRVLLSGGALGVSPRLAPAIAAGLKDAAWPPGRPIDIRSLALSPDTALLGAARLALAHPALSKGLS